MKILLINIDSVIPNVALKKLEKYYLDRDEEVIWDLPLAKNIVDQIYVSCIFTKNRHLCREWEGIAEIGGIGYDLYKKLPKEIESVMVKINFGFTTRGCIRKCPFCFVPEKEGMVHVVGDIYDIWDGKSREIILMDNNILALPEHFKIICGQLRKEKLRVDFNQGLDVRLLTDDLACEIKSLKMKRIRFAFDDPKHKPIIEKKMEILHKYNIAAMWYVLVGYNSNIDEEIARINYLKSHKQYIYIMRHQNCYADKRYNILMVWTNAPGLGNATIPFSDFINKHIKGIPYQKYFEGTKWYIKPELKKESETLFDKQNRLRH